MLNLKVYRLGFRISLTGRIGRRLLIQKETKLSSVSRFEIDNRLDQPMCAGGNVKATNV